MPFYYHSHDGPAPNGFVATMRKAYRPLGFRKGYNFPLWVFFAGAAFAFALSRAMYLDVRGTYASAKIATGDWYYQSHAHEYVGIVMHLAVIFPIGLLIPWQFVPAIRYRFILFHRINGYLLLILLILCNASAFMLARRALGGELETQAFVGMLGITTTISAALAYYNIKVLQIDQHRAWMLRTWFYAFSIITLRLVQGAALMIVSGMHNYFIPMPCPLIDSINEDPTASARYATCREDPNSTAAVRANMNVPDTDPMPLEEIGATVQITFGMAGWIAFVMHAVGLEIYLALTPAESRRLKKVSYEKQLARGYKRPGCAGTTAEMWGDAEAYVVDQEVGKGESEAKKKRTSESGLEYVTM